MKNFTYKSQYGIVVICSNEEEQAEIYKMLESLGLKLKVVVV